MMKKWSKAGIVCAAVLAASMAMTACGGKTAETGNTGEAGRLSGHFDGAGVSRVEGIDGVLCGLMAVVIAPPGEA